MKFRKKPVVIDAIEWKGNNIDEALTFIQDGQKDFKHLPNNSGYVEPGVGYTPPSGELTIPTLEGDHIAKPGDWIIRGVKGEFYPCKPDIFTMTYEKVEEEIMEEPKTVEAVVQPKVPMSHEEAIKQVKKQLDNGGFDDRKKMMNIELISIDWREWYESQE